MAAMVMTPPPTTTKVILPILLGTLQRLELINVRLNAAELDHVALAGCCTLCRFVYQDDRVGGGHHHPRERVVSAHCAPAVPGPRPRTLRDRSRVQPARGSSRTRDPPPCIADSSRLAKVTVGLVFWVAGGRPNRAATATAEQGQGNFNSSVEGGGGARAGKEGGGWRSSLGGQT
ncbi:hypothetical protein PGQ11_005604 [Apiospora arundinis]|uniref:Uncharacterized protein n=1 Tax=Apiospora arundinis TaxID=335852 RepID=A0ABR2JB97_9PEZI